MNHIHILLIIGLMSLPDFSGQPALVGENTEFRKELTEEIIPKYEQSSFQQQVPAFNAIITERRTADIRTGDAVYLQRFNQVTINVGNVFDTYTGIFTVPADGLYHLSGWFLIGDYQCRTFQFLRDPVSFDVTMLKNNTQVLAIFKFPVAYNSDNTSRQSITGQEFNLLLKLQAGDAIRLKVLSKKCDDRKEAFFNKVIFSGFKVY